MEPVLAPRRAESLAVSTNGGAHELQSAPATVFYLLHRLHGFLFGSEQASRTRLLFGLLQSRDEFCQILGLQRHTSFCGTHQLNLELPAKQFI
jgi:hypothetical protein